MSGVSSSPPQKIWQTLPARIAALTFLGLLLSRLVIFGLSVYWDGLNHQSIPVYDRLCQYDCNQYRAIVLNGYRLEPYESKENHPSNWAFFPLYPLLLRGFNALIGLDPHPGGALLSSLLLGLAVGFGGLYALRTRGRSEAVTLGLLLLFGPYTFYYSTLLTESLYVFLLALAFVFIQRRQWLAAGLVGALLSAVRATGFLILLPMLAALLEDAVRARTRPLDWLRSVLNNPRLLLSFALVPAGLAAHMTYLSVRMGDALAFVHILHAWGRVSRFPLLSLWQGFQGRGGYNGPEDIYLAAWGAAGLLAGLYLLYKKRWGEGLFALASILSALSQGPISIPRYIVGAFVPYLAAADLLQKTGRFKWPILAGLFAAEVVLLFCWFEGLHWLA